LFGGVFLSGTTILALLRWRILTLAFYTVQHQRQYARIFFIVRAVILGSPLPDRVVGVEGCGGFFCKVPRENLKML
jgi:hypothetical protein